ncbi:VraH family peptide resistance protein [Staphylococcus canis]|uniref:VraH family protein n=1 Tax=Staphylococcus canis TaxID=2724942 RepID=A0ABS0T8E1_9STAP|nr:VraH family protein [Staphylococcus canis]MBI5974952.1 VraH family protein [Staphylococcus canis]
MDIRNYIMNVKENILNMKIGSKSFFIMIISMIILSMIFTPFIGIPVGLLIGSYSYSKS